MTLKELIRFRLQLHSALYLVERGLDLLAAAHPTPSLTKLLINMLENVTYELSSVEADLDHEIQSRGDITP